MAVRINFDPTGNVETPVFVLATRNGTKLGDIPAESIVYRDGLNTCSEMSFKVHKTTDGKDYALWEQLKDFKLMWVRDFDTWYEIYVELDESDDTLKNVTAKSLGEAELSQINLYGLEVNTDAEIEKEGYTPTVFYDEFNHKNSLLHRLMEKAAHYRIDHVDFSIAEIQRVFSFDAVSIYDAMQTVSKEINCLFVINSGSDEYGNIDRAVSVYDLESYCIDCGHREEFTAVCPKCGGKNISSGYGEYTTIYVDRENLADNITFSTDTGAVKNCFKLVAGDDLMTETLASCNPNGSAYIWYISDELKEDMSVDLITRLGEYDTQYGYYYNEHITDLSGETLNAYNELISKYFAYNDQLREQEQTVTGYPNLVESLFTAADFYEFVNSGFMPEDTTRKTASYQAATINYVSLSPVAMDNPTNATKDSVNSAVLAVAQTLIHPDYTVELVTSTYSDGMFSGIFRVSNSDGTDVATTGAVNVDIIKDDELLIEQKIAKALAKYKTIPGIVKLFNLSSDGFIKSLVDYNLEALTTLEDAALSVIDLLIEEGISNRDEWANKDPDLYRNIYEPHYRKLYFVKNEIKVRKAEIAAIAAFRDEIETYKNEIQEALNFEKFLGDELWLDFIAYRREDTYTNSGYVSDGLTNGELYTFALEFIDVAKKDIFKSATLQHSISATLKNLLAMKEFAPLTNYFEVGNWIQVKVDGIVYRLRLIDYEINFDSLENIAITFSDVKKVATGVTDTQDILDQAATMATSYGALMRQSGQNAKSSEQLDDWVNKGMALTKMKIIDSAENQNITWDSHGLLCREYLPITDTYNEKQLKIINKGLYLTDDNWETSKAGIGNFTFYNPMTGQFEQSYGVIADTLVGNLILGENVGIYNTENSITMDENGLIITSNGTGDTANSVVFQIQRKQIAEDGTELTIPAMFVDSDGNLVLNGTIRINSSADTNVSTLDDLTDTSRWTDQINNAVHTEAQIIYNEIDAKYNTILQETTAQLEQYKADIGQYMQFGDDGLTLGATSSEFKTVIDNRGMYFKQGDTTVSYVNNNQLYIPNGVIENTLILGSFFFSPRADGGVSLTWQG